ncbi:myosin-K heavy chain-like [Macrobrachium nipponense]|uniref:myosin-K heavy chain-like n=1 Tax=Macrobrachium nipponense TaxID=159736 RepID=UPI0030C7B142
MWEMIPKGPGMGERAMPQVLGQAGKACRMTQDGQVKLATGPGTGGRGPPWVRGRAGKVRHRSQDWQARPETCPRMGMRGPLLVLNGGARPAMVPETGGEGAPCDPGPSGEACYVFGTGGGRPATGPGMGGGGPPLVTGRMGEAHHGSCDGQGEACQVSWDRLVRLAVYPVTGKRGPQRFPGWS